MTFDPEIVAAVERSLRLVKTFTKRAHAEALMDGAFFCRSPAWFHQVESGRARQDAREGLVAEFPKGTVSTLSLGSHRIQGDGARRVSIQMTLSEPTLARLRIWCGGLGVSRRALADVPEVWDQLAREGFPLPIRSDLAAWGDWSVIFPEDTLWLDRLRLQADGAGVFWQTGRVKYGGAERRHTFRQSVRPGEQPAVLNSLFVKDARYGHEREWRVLFDGDDLPDPYTVQLEGGLPGAVLMRSTQVADFLGDAGTPSEGDHT